MKFDIMMWTLNGERFLPSVLRRVEEAIPKKIVHKKIMVDDHSTDNTVKIAKDFNWEVYSNPSTGISSGANEALRHTECVLAAHNEEPYLRYTIASLNRLPLNRFVIVLDRCSDNSERLVMKLQKPKTIIRNPELTWSNKISQLRAVTQPYLRCDFVLVTDADIILDEASLRLAMQLIKNVDVVCFTYKQYSLYGSGLDRLRDEISNVFAVLTRKLRFHPVRTGIYLGRRQKLFYHDYPSEYDQLERKLHTKWIETRTLHLRPRYDRESQLKRGRARATLPQYRFWKIVVASILTLEPYVVKGFLEAKN